ncbi:MAG: ABC transporter permease [Capsulimonadaceae bacterium]
MTAMLTVTRPAPVLRGPRGWRWSAAKYGAIVQTRLASNVAYAAEMLFRVVFLVPILFVLTQLWRTTYAAGGGHYHRIAGFTLAQMVWYLVLTESIAMSRPMITSEIDEEVRSEGLAVALGRPCHYLLYHLCVHLGDRLVRFAICLTVGGALALLAVGPIHITGLGAVTATLATALAVLIDFGGVLCIGLGALWVEDTRSMSLLYSRMGMILGGMLMPLSVFPRPLARLCEWLPLSAVYSAPGRIFAAGTGEGAAAALGLQCFWAVAIWLLAVLIYRKGVRHVESNGG